MPGPSYNATTGFWEFPGNDDHPGTDGGNGIKSECNGDVPGLGWPVTYRARRLYSAIVEGRETVGYATGAGLTAHTGTVVSVVAHPDVVNFPEAQIMVEAPGAVDSESVSVALIDPNSDPPVTARPYTWDLAAFQEAARAGSEVLAANAGMVGATAALRAHNGGTAVVLTYLGQETTVCWADTWDEPSYPTILGRCQYNVHRAKPNNVHRARPSIGTVLTDTAARTQALAW